jgi:hypothetical protein
MASNVQVVSGGIASFSYTYQSADLAISVFCPSVTISHIIKVSGGKKPTNNFLGWGVEGVKSQSRSESVLGVCKKKFICQPSYNCNRKDFNVNVIYSNIELETEQH